MADVRVEDMPEFKGKQVLVDAMEKGHETCPEGMDVSYVLITGLCVIIAEMKDAD